MTDRDRLLLASPFNGITTALLGESSHHFQKQ
jgi:hypothetical protein